MPKKIPTVSSETAYSTEVLERHADALHRFRRALCGPDKQDHIEDADRIATLVKYYTKRKRQQRRKVAS